MLMNKYNIAMNSSGVNFNQNSGVLMRVKADNDRSAKNKTMENTNKFSANMNFRRIMDFPFSSSSTLPLIFKTVVLKK